MTNKFDENDYHHWTGWPGAMCLKCRCEDPYEIAMSDGTLMITDRNTVEAISEEVQAELDRKSICPVKGKMVYQDSKWYLVHPNGVRELYYDFTKETRQ